jgi:hypothetical protein
MAKAATPEAIDTLIKVMRGKKVPAAAKVSAANSLLDRAWGRPESTSNVNVTDNRKDARDYSTKELIDYLNSQGVAVSEDGSEESDKVH